MDKRLPPAQGFLVIFRSLINFGQKYRLSHSVVASFNTTTEQMTEISQ